MFDGEKVRLRGFRESDRVAFHQHDRDAAVINIDGPYDFAWGTADGDGYLDEHRTVSDRRYGFVIASLDDDRVVGRTMLWTRPLPHRHATFGIYLFPEERGRGAGTDALQVLLRFAFNGLGLHRLGLTVRADNPARHLYERLGFQREVVWREDLVIDGELRDQWVMGLLEDEYRAQVAS